MIWTALFENTEAKTFSTGFNCRKEAAEIAQSMAAEMGTRVYVIIKGNCENNTFFL